MSSKNKNETNIRMTCYDAYIKDNYSWHKERFDVMTAVTPQLKPLPRYEGYFDLIDNISDAECEGLLALSYKMSGESEAFTNQEELEKKKKLRTMKHILQMEDRVATKKHG